MKSISPELSLHLQGDSTTLATCIKVTLTDGSVFGFTDHDKPILFDSTLYHPDSGYTPSTISSNDKLSVDNLDIEAFLNSTILVESELLAGKWDFAEIEMFMVNYEDLTQGQLYLRKGTLGEIRLGKNSFVTELRGMTQPLQQIIGEIYSPTCRVKRFCDERCKLNRNDFSFNATIIEIVNDTTFVIDNDFGNIFMYGEALFTSGQNIDVLTEIKSNSGSSIELQIATPFALEVGDTVTLVQGCDRTINSCIGFGNVINFRGEPYVPGMDKMIRGAS